jgi:hypothetical protein
MIVSARSHLSAGLAAGLVLAATGAAVVAPTAGPPPITVASPAVALTAALTAFPQLPVIDFSGVADSPGDWIINAYGVIQPWVAYGVELFAWATEWLPWPIGLLAPQADIIYSGWQPFAESVAYSLAFLVDGEFDLILPTLSAGIQTGITNLVQGEIDWILSFFPPLPPIGIAAAEATTRTVGRLAQQAPAAATTETVSAETVSAETVVSELEPTATTAEAPSAASEPDAAPVAAAEEQPATVEVAEAAPQPRRAIRGDARMPQSVPAASATKVTEAAPEAAADPAPEPKARKASRGADSNATSTRAGRADRAAR